MTAMTYIYIVRKLVKINNKKTRPPYNHAGIRDGCEVPFSNSILRLKKSMIGFGFRVQQVDVGFATLNLDPKQIITIVAGF